MGSMVALPGNAQGDGVDEGYLALPESGSGPGVLVLHAWWGRTQFILDLCDRLAAEGFVALAPDLFRGKTAATVEQAEQLVNTASDDVATRVSNAAVDALRAHPAVTGDGIAVLGISFGAAWALVLSGARPADVTKSIVVYGTYPDVEISNARASYQGHFAADDPYEPTSLVEEMEAALRAAGRPAAFYTYPDTGHWFFESDRPEAYVAAAADLAWERMVAFLRQ